MLFINLYSPRTKWPPFCRRHFQMPLHEWKVLYSNSYITEVCSWRLSWQWVTTDSGIVLVRSRRQAITSTNADSAHQPIYAAAGGGRFLHRPLGQNGRRFTADIFKCVFLNKNVRILIKISPDSLTHICSTRGVKLNKHCMYGCAKMLTPLDSW